MTRALHDVRRLDSVMKVQFDGFAGSVFRGGGDHLHPGCAAKVGALLLDALRRIAAGLGHEPGRDSEAEQQDAGERLDSENFLHG